MSNPPRGRSPCRALAVLLLAGAGLLAPPPQPADAQNTGQGNNQSLSPQMIQTIDDVVNLLGQAVQQGDEREIRAIDHALRDLIRALEQQQQQGQQGHHHRRHHQGAIQRGLGQFAGSGSGSTSTTSVDPTTGTSSSTSTSGSGSFGQGLGQASGGTGTTSHHRHHRGSFGNGLQQAMSGAGGTTGTTGASSSNSARSGTNNGVNLVSTTINNQFNGPARVNINNGQQTLAANSGATRARPSASGTGGATPTVNGGGIKMTAGNLARSGNLNTGGSAATTVRASPFGGALPARSLPGLSTMAKNKVLSQPLQGSQLGKLPNSTRLNGTAMLATGGNFSNRNVGGAVGSRPLTTQLAATRTSRRR